MYLDREIFSKLAGSKTFNMYLILEYMTNSKHPKTMNDFKDHFDFSDEKRGTIADSGRVIRNYLDEMEELGLIQSNRNQKTYTWELAGKLRELENIPIRKKNMPCLLSWRIMFEKYKFLPFFGDVQEYITENESSIKEYLDDKEKGVAPEEIYRIADFETASEFKGVDFIDKFYTAIDDRTAITFRYRAFGKKNEKQYDNFEPYILKEHKKRWYVVGKMDGEFRTFALDRVTEIIGKMYEEFERVPFDPDTFWEDSMGIYTSWRDSNGNHRKDPIQISFKVKDGDKLKDGNLIENISYLESSPIHHSQKPKVLKKDADGYAKVNLKVIPDADVVRALRALGQNNLKEITPKFFSDWVMKY